MFDYYVEASTLSPPPILTVAQAFDLISILFSVNWWNARYFKSDSRAQMKIICHTWFVADGSSRHWTRAINYFEDFFFNPPGFRSVSML